MGSILIEVKVFFFDMYPGKKEKNMLRQYRMLIFVTNFSKSHILVLCRKKKKCCLTSVLFCFFQNKIWNYLNLDKEDWCGLSSSHIKPKQADNHMI